MIGWSYNLHVRIMGIAFEDTDDGSSDMDHRRVQPPSRTHGTNTDGM